MQPMATSVFRPQAAFALGNEEPEDHAEILAVPIHAFDLIVADECHRGYTSADLSLWRNTLDHSGAVNATPAAHTKAYSLVYHYEYERTPSLKATW
jgi:type I restriction enzyme R subunit